MYYTAHAFWIFKCKIMIMKFYTELPLNLCDLCSINTQKPKHIFHFIQTVSIRKKCSWEIKLFSLCNNLLMIRILNSKKIDRWSFLLDFISFTFSQWSVKNEFLQFSLWIFTMKCNTCNLAIHLHVYAVFLDLL